MKTLIFAPHPDDETLGCGGYIKQQVDKENTVQVIFLTSGEHGCPGMPVEEARAIRQNEARQAAKVLGHDILSFWDYPDGGLVYSKELVERIATTINTLHPDRVMVTHEHESHPDHRIAGRLVRAAKEQAYGPEYLVYEVWTPQARCDRVIDISDQITYKMQAILQHKSQIGRVKFDVASSCLSRFRGIMQGRCEFAEVYGRLRASGESVMRITVALLTWAPSVNHPRHEYAMRTMKAALANIDPGEHELHFHIADDGSAKDHVDALVHMCQKAGFEPTVTNAERGGYGKSYNLMMQVCHPISDVILPLEDDWELTRPLKLEAPARALELSNGTIKCIRLGYLGFTQELRGRVVSEAGALYLLLDPDSSEPHVFAGHPRLETVDYEREVGPWPEGIAAGQTEWEVTHRWPARSGVVWPLDLGVPASQDWGTLFAHIGSESAGELIPEGAK
jgi:LmbE family N-acetylglucosaminyl deacetylase